VIKLNNEVFSNNQVAKVLLKNAIEVAKKNMSDDFRKHYGLDIVSMTAREQKELDKSIEKWCGRLEKTLNINFDYDASVTNVGEEVEKEVVYYQLKSGGFAAKDFYFE
tara:strand:- start:30 stop:353 length:324 start_codon:yes stop_codon:yes gene_type:complete